MALAPITPNSAVSPEYQTWLERNVLGALDLVETAIPAYDRRQNQENLNKVLTSLFVQTYSANTDLACSLFQIDELSEDTLKQKIQDGLILIQPGDCDTLQMQGHPCYIAAIRLDVLDVSFMKTLLTQISNKVSDIFRKLYVLDPQLNISDQDSYPTTTQIQQSDDDIQRLTTGKELLFNIFDKESPFPSYPLSPSSQEDFAAINEYFKEIETVLGKNYLDRLYFHTYLLKQDAVANLPENVKPNAGRAILGRWDEVTKTSPIPFSSEDLQAIYKRITAEYFLDQLTLLAEKGNLSAASYCIDPLKGDIADRLFFHTWKVCEKKISDGDYNSDVNFGSKAWLDPNIFIDLEDHFAALNALKIDLAKEWGFELPTPVEGQPLQFANPQ